MQYFLFMRLFFAYFVDWIVVFNVFMVLCLLSIWFVAHVWCSDCDWQWLRFLLFFICDLVYFNFVDKCFLLHTFTGDLHVFGVRLSWVCEILYEVDPTPHWGLSRRSFLVTPVISWWRYVRLLCRIFSHHLCSTIYFLSALVVHMSIPHYI